MAKCSQNLYEKPARLSVVKSIQHLPVDGEGFYREKNLNHRKLPKTSKEEY